MHISFAAVVAGLAWVHNADASYDLTKVIAERRHFINSVHRKDLSHCVAKLRADGVEARSFARRSAAIEKARALRGFSRNNPKDVLPESHEQTRLGYTESVKFPKLLRGNSSCLLTPEVVQRPYYVDDKFIRRDITESEPGVDITLDYQIIDVDTCEPVHGVYVEIWHCNSTGVSGGAFANGSGNTDYGMNLDATLLRGIQETDSDGVVQFKSIFPGYLTGRATHINIMVHPTALLVSHNKFGKEDSKASHVGQTFFDQDLITAVGKNTPYSTNTQELTENDKDDVLAEEPDGVSSFMDYVYLGDDLDSGLYAWIALGINKSYSSDLSPASDHFKGRGNSNEDFDMSRGSDDAGNSDILTTPPSARTPGGMPWGTAPESESTATTSTSSEGVGHARLLSHGSIAIGIGLAILLQ